MGLLIVAWAHIRYHSGRSVLLVLVLAVVASIPLMTERLAAIAERQLLARAAATPLIFGPASSRLDLVLSALFFEGRQPSAITMADYDMIAETGLGTAVPLLLTHSARGLPIVGTDIEYFAFRGLAIASGRQMARVGEVVIGAQVARRLGIAAGDDIQSDTTEVFKVGGDFPVRMAVVGVLGPTGSDDDRAVFADLKTAWIIAGLGHGHDDVVAGSDESVVLSRSPGVVVANARLKTRTAINAASLETFHYHGDEASFPLTAIIVDPHTAKDAALLRGRVADLADQTRQILRPGEVVTGLLDQIFKIKTVLNLLVAAVGLAAILALLMMIWLSLKLRRSEFETALRIGIGRLAIARLVGAELALLVITAALLCAGVVAIIEVAGTDLTRAILFDVW